MSYKVEKLPDMPVVITTVYADFDMAREGQSSMDEAIALFNTEDEPVYYIDDVSRYSPSLDDVMATAHWRGERGNMPVLRHPNVRESIMISRSKIVKLAAQGVKTASWGGIVVRVFDTLDGALAYVREQTGKPA